VGNRIAANAVGQGSQGSQETQPQTPLHVFVIDTGNQATSAAIRAAAALAKGLDAHMTLLAAVEVPCPLDLQEPPVSIAFMEDRLRELVAQTEIPARVELRLCRDRRQAVRDVLPAEAIVVMAGRTGWFHRAARRFAATLIRDGHKVFFVEE
jgi:hypothetical protein